MDLSKVQKETYEFSNETNSNQPNLEALNKTARFVIFGLLWSMSIPQNEVGRVLKGGTE